ncbi:alpha/beta fold hydrolase [Nocardioides sp. CFH 31398]|uniref:esterase/lipase family protein n=1 Tax=Nocardioides sp. CFH 31398 TaxID=2919579 RepID=UPI0027E157D6|nr:alpha/beta fold hydrolase [Nocardioides sp. CFH 31398]
MVTLGIRRAALLVALLGGLLLALVSPSSAGTARASTVEELSHPFGSPVGANDWSCRPTEARPTPVVLVHGTFADSRTPLDRISARVKAAGYCVYSVDYGLRGTQRIEDSARTLAAFVDRVLASTGAAQVSLVGHSQGGMMPRYYLKNLGGLGKVDDLVGLAPSNYGTFRAELLAPAGAIGCPACAQQGAGSAFLRDLNTPDDSPGDVSYTNVVTRYDTVVVPHTNGYLTPADNVTNVRLQDVCPGNLADHVFIPANRTAIAITLDALSRPGPARASGYSPTVCLP